MSLAEQYKQLLEMTKEEQVILQESRFEELQAILERKRELIQEIEGKGSLAGTPEAKEVLDIASEIKRMGDTNRKLLEEELRSTRRQLEKLLSSWQTVQDYHNFSKREASILDIKG